VKTCGGFAEVDSAQMEPGQLVEMRELFYPALYLKPELAGLAMALSSITVTANALRLRRA
jgi:cation transport ATPase